MDSFWSVIGIVLWAFVFIAYLMVLFNVLIDLFRDQQLSGWWKAVWIVFLIFVPLLTALVYLIARGRGTADRHLAAARQAQGQQDAYIRQVAGVQPGPSAAESIAKSKALLDEGAITQAEFDSLKAKALA